MHITANLASQPHPNNRQEIVNIINILPTDSNSKKSASDRIDIVCAILHILASRRSDFTSMEYAKELQENNDGILLHDIKNWTILPGLAATSTP